ncbi:MAG: zinc ribbon domain-containing protein [Candidatus Caldarchaeum sp.]
MRRCSACRLSLPADAFYCHECGRRVEEGKRRKLLFSLVLALALTVTTAAYVQWTAATSSTESWAKELRAAGFNAVADGGYVVVDTRGLDVADFDRLLAFLKTGMRMALVRDVPDGVEPAMAEVVAKVVRSVEGVEDVVYDGGALTVYMSHPTGYQLYRVFKTAESVYTIVIILPEKI